MLHEVAPLTRSASPSMVIVERFFLVAVDR